MFERTIRRDDANWCENVIKNSKHACVCGVYEYVCVCVCVCMSVPLCMHVLRAHACACRYVCVNCLVAKGTEKTCFTCVDNCAYSCYIYIYIYIYQLLLNVCENMYA
jgi:hypothetical protein